ncbi:unnamed protein product, partial [Candidula unifasciata]
LSMLLPTNVFRSSLSCARPINDICLSSKLIDLCLPLLCIFFFFFNKRIYHHASHSCLTGSDAGTFLTLQPCTNDRHQIWIWPENTFFPRASNQSHYSEPAV